MFVIQCMRTGWPSIPPPPSSHPFTLLCCPTFVVFCVCSENGHSSVNNINQRLFHSKLCWISLVIPLHSLIWMKESQIGGHVMWHSGGSVSVLSVIKLLSLYNMKQLFRKMSECVFDPGCTPLE